MRIGQVLGFALEYDEAADRLGIPVRCKIELERFAFSALAAWRGPLANAWLLVRQGKRALLASTNLPTGQRQIALEILPNAAPVEITMQDGMIVMPLVPGQFAGIFDALTQLLARVEALPFEQIGRSSNDTLAGVDAQMRNPALAASLVSLQETLAATQAMVRRIDAATAPALRGVPPLMTSLQTTATQANRLIASANRGYGDELQFHRDFDRLLEQMTAAASSLRTPADTLNRNPEPLVRGHATHEPRSYRSGVRAGRPCHPARAAAARCGAHRHGDRAPPGQRNAGLRGRSQDGGRPAVQRDRRHVSRPLSGVPRRGIGAVPALRR